MMNIPCVVQLQSYLYNWALADEFSDNYHLRWTRVGGVVADHDDEAIASFLEVDGEADAATATKKRMTTNASKMMRMLRGNSNRSLAVLD
mmetsp:Transcript_54370/g.90061  ORF Transcript_54370/g.90061 Transcript_54370/m.90061 type:complete len:90 (-) Transcript_54370:98-367(-)